MPNPFSRFTIQDIIDRDAEKLEPHPRRVWAGIFFAEIVLIFFVLLAHSYVYNYMRTNGSFQQDDNPPAVTGAKLNRKGLAEVTAMFDKKNARFQELLLSSPAVADPSAMTATQNTPGGISVQSGTTTSAQ